MRLMMKEEVESAVRLVRESHGETSRDPQTASRLFLLVVQEPGGRVLYATNAPGQSIKSLSFASAIRAIALRTISLAFGFPPPTTEDP